MCAFMAERVFVSSLVTRGITKQVGSLDQIYVHGICHSLVAGIWRNAFELFKYINVYVY